MLERILSALQSLPSRKVVDRNSHAVLDYLTVSFFLLLGSAFWDRNKRASVTALVNGFMVLGVSMFTDYSGSARKLINFRTHGHLDVVQAATAMTMPILLGFGGSTAALPFQLQAMNEVMVLSVTDFGPRREALTEPSLRRTA